MSLIKEVKEITMTDIIEFINSKLPDNSEVHLNEVTPELREQVAEQLEFNFEEGETKDD